MRDDKIACALLLATAQLLRAFPSGQPGEPENSLCSAADSLASAILSRRMKAVQSLLGTEKRPQVNLTLNLLTAIVERGPRLAGELVRSFDFDLPAFSKAARPPRCAPR